MKNRFFTTGVAICMVLSTYGQQPPQLNNSNPNSNNFWSRAGNNQGNGGNVFGTRYNSPVYFYTGGTTSLGANRRAKLNGIFTNAINQYQINNYTWNDDVNTTGYFLLGQDLGAPGGNIYRDLGAFSLLHLNGRDGTFVQDGGYRPWMKTGVFNLENSDNLYVGLKSEGFNRSDAIFAWGDDGNGNGLNNARFIFSGTGPVNGSCTNCPTTPGGLNGREVMRMNPNGNIGVGPLFVQNNQPKSTMHMHIENNFSNWLQFSNQNLGPNQNVIGQNDGFRIGILGSNANL